MGEYRCPKLRDLRDIYLLFAECCELGADPIAWRLHLLDRLPATMGTSERHVGLCAEMRINPWRGSTKRIGVVDRGWPDVRDRTAFLRGMNDWHATGCDGFARWTQAEVRVATHTRDSLFGGESKALATRFYQNQFKLVGMHDLLISRGYVALGRIHVILLMRPDGVVAFSNTHRRLLHLLQLEITSQLGKRLALLGEPSLEDLPVRLRQVLTRLLLGDSEKQVAFHLGISHHTVHDYVKRLHGYFDVSSRGELLARCRGLTPVAERAFPSTLVNSI